MKDYLFYQGSLDSFKLWLSQLDKTSKKYQDICNSIVWIHSDIGKSDIEDITESGWLYVNGVYFTAVAVEDTMKVIDDRVYLNGIDNKKEPLYYKLLNNSDVINKTERDYDILTYDYLKEAHKFEDLNTTSTDESEVSN